MDGSRATNGVTSRIRDARDALFLWIGVMFGLVGVGEWAELAVTFGFGVIVIIGFWLGLDVGREHPND